MFSLGYCLNLVILMFHLSEENEEIKKENEDLKG